MISLKAEKLKKRSNAWFVVENTVTSNRIKNIYKWANASRQTQQNI